MTVMARFMDGLTNLVANLGTSRDKASSSAYTLPFLTDNDLINAYRAAWLPRKIVEVPARDALRNWREWQAEEDEIEKLDNLEKRLDLRSKVLEAKIKANLFGGAAVYISTSTANLTTPLSPTEKIRGLTVLTRRQLTATELDMNPESEWFGLPKSYLLINSEIEVHPSRLIRFIGKPLPESDAVVYAAMGWGDSVLLPVYQAVVSADSTGANIASLIFESKVDVIKIPGLMANLADPTYETQVLNRMSLASTGKGINGALLLDTEEEYEQKSANFSGLNELWLTALQVCSGASDIPITRLLGQSPGGLQSTGESDMRNYYDMVSSIQELDIQPAMSLFDELLVQNALGKSSADVWYTWAPLWQPTNKERADIGKTIADTIKTLSDTQVFDPVALNMAGTNALVQAGVMPGIDQVEPPGEDDLAEQMRAAEQGSVSDSGFLDMAPRTLYVRRDVINKQSILDWAEEQGILVDEEPLHVTITYSRNPVDWMKMGQSYAGDNGRLRIEAGGPRSVELFDGGAVVLEFSSEELSWRHEEMIRKGATWDFPKYMPHITLTYSAVDLSAVEPYRGPIYLGPEIFEEVK